jgi:cell division protein FtsB
MLKIAQVFTCVSLFVFFLLSYLDRQNKVVELQLKLPKIAHEIEKISQENQTLKRKINDFEHPLQLMSFLKEDKYKHLSNYLDQDIVCLARARELIQEEKVEDICRVTPAISIATGVSNK